MTARALALCAVLAIAAPAAAQTARVEVPHCPAPEPALAAALRLEAGDGWRVDETVASLVVHVEVTGCDDEAWTLTVTDAGGDVVSGPERIAMGAFGESTRVRVAALWAAERLGVGPPPAGATLDVPSAEAVVPPPPREDSEPTEPAPAPAPTPSPAFRPRPVLDVDAGVAYLVDPARLSEVALHARAGLSAQVLEWLLLGGFLEGGALFEPFSHAQPFFRFCVEPRAELDVGPLRVGIAPKLCTSLSRHLRGAQDFWGGGLAVGAAMRASLPIADGVAIGLRIDADAWERDLIVGTPDIDASLGSVPDLSWVGVFGASLELDVR